MRFSVKNRIEDCGLLASASNSTMDPMHFFSKATHATGGSNGACLLACLCRPLRAHVSWLRPDEIPLVTNACVVCLLIQGPDAILPVHAYACVYHQSPFWLVSVCDDNHLCVCLCRARAASGLCWVWV